MVDPHVVADLFSGIHHHAGGMTRGIQGQHHLNGSLHSWMMKVSNVICRDRWDFVTADHCKSGSLGGWLKGGKFIVWFSRGFNFFPSRLFLELR